MNDSYINRVNSLEFCQNYDDRFSAEYNMSVKKKVRINRLADIDIIWNPL